MTKPFEFREYIHELSQMSRDEAEAQVGTPASVNFGQFCIDCSRIGLEELLKRYSEDEINLIVSSACSTSMWELMRNNNLDSFETSIRLAQSRTAKFMFESVFFFAVGLSIREEIR